MLDHLWTILLHHAVIWEILCPERHGKEGDTGVCSAIEFGERVGAVEEINYTLSIVLSGYGHVGVVELATCPAGDEGAHD